MRRRTTIGALAALVMAVGACSSGEEPKTTAKPSATPTTTSSTAPTPPPAPRVGSCHRLTLGQATRPVDAGRPVPCRGPHTSVTVKVGRIDQLDDGHLLAVDSATVRARIQEACPPDGLGYVGGDRTTQRLSRLEVVWFAPSLEEADAGADSYRCDVVGLAAAGRLMLLPAKVKGVLAQPGALDRFGTCGTKAPGERGFQRVACSRPHAWRAVGTYDFPPRTRYLGANAAAGGDAQCKDVAAARSGGATTYTWSFEWPTRVQWDAGQRYGYCWLPD